MTLRANVTREEFAQMDITLKEAVRKIVRVPSLGCHYSLLIDDPLVPIFLPPPRFVPTTSP